MRVRPESKMVILGWYGCVALLILLIIIVGGLTRLTGSGLSMVDWKLFMGIFPPISMTQWQVVFEQYQQSPEFIIKNSQMTLSEFKIIFLWEYGHRILGRVIGLALILPYVFFSIRRRLTGWLHRRSLVMIVGVVLQGLLGWYMVKSGLVDVPEVSHFRLASHLLLACFLLQFIIWTMLNLLHVSPNKSKWSLPVMIWSFGLVVQIVYGAFSAGTHAGFFYNTYPKMGGEWIPEAVFLYQSFIENIINNPIMIQFVHRHLAFVLMIASFWFAIVFLRSSQVSLYQKKLCCLILVVLFVQIVLGILTLIYVVPIGFASSHQIVGVVLLSCVTIFNHSLRYR